jgi:ABC-type uncharacterized transport system auxiliary subunit
MRSRALAILVVVVASTLASSCRSPDIRYYQLDFDENLLGGTPENGQIVLSVETLVGDAAFEDQRIVYRESPHRLDYYYYHRWTAPPGVMVSDFLREAYEKSGYFRTVVSGFSPEAPVFLNGRVVAFEEVDVGKKEWLARVKLDLHLRSAETGDIVWSRTITEEEPVEEQDPEGLAAALSRAVTRVVVDTAPEFASIGARIAERINRKKKRDSVLETLESDEETGQ